MVCKGIASVFKSPCGVGKVMFLSGGNSKRGYNERGDEQGFWREGVVLFVWVKVWLDGRTSPSSCIRVLQSHPFQDGGRWQFPGVGAFECYMKYMIEDLRTVAWQEGKPDWANKGPPIASDYNCPNDVPFFEEGEGSSSSNYEDHAWKKLKLANEQEIYEIK
ncbi:inactive beta-amylase 4, chloroplastic isoform X2 [Tanacetum coccineum]